MPPDASHESRQAPGRDPWWAETFVFDLWTDAGGLGAFTWLTLLPNQRRAWYWTALARDGEPLLHVVDLVVPLPSSGLRVRTTGLWADHHCEAPFEQWTIQNECYAVALDDPDDALGRGYGTSTPLAFDIEWYASSPPHDDGHGYRQDGSVHALLEVASGPLLIEGPGARSHAWGPLALDGPNRDEAHDGVPSDALRAPVVLADQDGPRPMERVLTPTGWWTHRREPVDPA